MKISELINLIEKLYKKDLAMDFDNSGANIITMDSNIKNILICLDITDEAVEYAIKNDVNMIISHHPVIFSKFKNILCDSFSNKIKKLISYDISAYSVHTNFDAEKTHGMGKIVVDQFDLYGNIKSEVPIEMIGDNGDGLGRFLVLDNPVSITTLKNKLINNFHIKQYFVRYYSRHLKDDAFIKKLAIMPGSGRSNVHDVIKLGADMYVSADLSHHDILDLYENDISYIDATHYGLERLFIYYMNDFLKNIITDKSINIYKFENKDF